VDQATEAAGATSRKAGRQVSGAPVEKRPRGVRMVDEGSDIKEAQRQVMKIEVEPEIETLDRLPFLPRACAGVVSPRCADTCQRHALHTRDVEIEARESASVGSQPAAPAAHITGKPTGARIPGRRN